MFPASQFSCTYGGWLCFLGRPACPAPNCRNRGLRGMGAARCFAHPDYHGGRRRGVPAPPRNTNSGIPFPPAPAPAIPFPPAPAPAKPPRAGPAFPPPPQNACRARGPARPAAARIGRERRHQRAIAEFAAAHPKLPAGLCAPATGGRRLPPCALERGEGQRTGSCPPPLPPPPELAQRPSRSRFRAACCRALCGRRHVPAVRPAGGGGSPPRPPGLSARGARGPQADEQQASGRVKSTFSSTVPVGPADAVAPSRGLRDHRVRSGRCLGNL